ncbi:cell division protein FtsZ [Metamycoplasma alkalescens]|uniref:Cell division protein FtsZ n=2 Tax=Metamycoplasma alkalescens TaxID=45363 RepID=N9SS36_9BACT|nr:cell division protein FtsZ [Metamycoplasma alkalescens]ENY54199.1 Cell division protein FtsZ [Metamycoplasma alkalescens 14918]PYF42222.1 cell division protein FtsZ [Metamycoplasma alkalescens]SYV90112.1 cell division protein FtsZ [Metamycoplasma alkalescens]
MLDTENFNSVAKIKVIGVGGGGNNSIQGILDTKIDGLEFIVANTDKQILDRFDKSVTLQLGDKRGIGAGANPEVGKKAAEHSIQEIKEKIKNANLVVITAGMGGGTGTGAAPVIAKAAKEQNSLVIAIVTTPFEFEGIKRNKVAKEGIEELKKYVDSYIIISNDKLGKEYGDINFKDAFSIANNIVKQFIRTVVDIIAVPGLINLDLADLETLIKDAGETIVGIGNASGENAAQRAMINAISSPILESNIEISKAIVYFSSSTNNSINDFQLAINELKKIAGQNIDVIFGVGTSNNDAHEKLGETYVSVIATGNKKNQDENDFHLLENENHKDSYHDEETTQEFLTFPGLFSESKKSYSNQNDFNDEDNDLVHRNFRN